MEVGVRPKWGQFAFIAVVFVAVAITHYRYVIADFTRGASLLDTGWFAFLLGAGDPLLQNPKVIGEFSYYNIHISPYFSTLSVLARAFGIDGFQALALHQGLSFGLLFLGLALLATLANGISSWLMLLAAGLLMLASDVVLQVASLPHYEQAILSFAALGLFAVKTRRWVAASLLLGTATLVREDGGLYVALFLLADVLSNPGLNARGWWRSYSFRCCLLAIAASLMLFWIKGSYFNLVPTFASNFSGENWSHLSFELVGDRLGSSLAKPAIGVTLAAAVALAFLNWRFGLTVIFLLPLVAAHLASVRDDLGTFNYYYVMVWLVPWVGFFAEQPRMGHRKRIASSLVICVAAFCLTVPVLQSLGHYTYGHMLGGAFQSRLIDPAALASGVLEATGQFENPCFSSGAAALVPDQLAGPQWITPGASLSTCDAVILAVGDVHYSNLHRAAQDLNFVLQQTVLGRIEVYTPGSPS